MHIAILGRQPALGMAELEHLYGAKSVRWFSEHTAMVDAPSLPLDYLGGSLKTGRVVAELAHGDWHQASTKIVQLYIKKWSQNEGKITLGISAYGFTVSTRDIQKTGLILKQKLKNSSTSLRLIPNQEAALNTATSHHNKLGLAANKVELLVIRADNGRIVIAESTGAQNITSLARRDQGRPKRDAFVGMLPPKLAQIMVNLASPVSSRTDSVESKHLQPEFKEAPVPPFEPGAKPFTSSEIREDDRGGKQESRPLRLLDPFCGTGVVLQEAALMGYDVYGTDLAEKMVDYSKINLQWLAETYHHNFNVTLQQGDAMEATWQPPIDTVVCEGYLGQPFSAPPSPAKLQQVIKNCDHITSSFLKNIGSQITPGTPLCVAVPAWRDKNGHFSHLPLTHKLEQLGYTPFVFKHLSPSDLLYYREDQVVARELLVLIKA